MVGVEFLKFILDLSVKNVYIIYIQNFCIFTSIFCMTV